jgi:hypothetical protein
MNREQLLAQYRVLRQLTDDHDGWLQHPYGVDLWVDGLNVFLSVGEDDFAESLDRFLAEHGGLVRKIDCLQALQRFCLASAKEGEFELYQALSVGMTWLSLHMELKNPFFNLPLEITDHSTALLLSPTYLSLWAHSYNAGIGLYTDLNTDDIMLFRPEHGRVCESGKPHQQHAQNFLFSSYIHEMAHIFFFHELYSRVVGENEAEDASYIVHLEAICCFLCDNILAELVAVRDDLTILEDGFLALLNHDLTPGEDLLAVARGQRPGLNGRALSIYTAHHMQRGEGEFFIADNRVKQTILDQFAVSESEEDLIRPTRYGYYTERMKSHAKWGNAAGQRNRIPAFRETVELVPADPYCLQKLEESLHPDSWPTLEKLFSLDPFPEPDPNMRAKNLELWDWRELLFRLAETRGYLQTVGGASCQPVLERLLTVAEKVAERILAHDEKAAAVPELHEQLKGEIAQEIREGLFGLPDGELREKTLEMFGGNPYAFLLEPH